MADLVLHPSETSLVVIDLQKGVLSFPVTPHASTDVVDRSARLIASARETGAQVFLVRVAHSADRKDALQTEVDEPMRFRGSMPPDWSDLVPELHVQPADVMVTKRQWGAFYGTDLDLQLRRRRQSTVVLCGLVTEFGVDTTARGAYERGYHVVLAEDAMSGASAEGHAYCTKRIFPRLGRVRSTDEIIAALHAGSRAK